MSQFSILHTDYRLLYVGFRGRIAAEGSVKHLYDYKGVAMVLVGGDSGLQMDIDQATELAIDAGAEDVARGYNSDEQEVIRVLFSTF